MPNQNKTNIVAKRLRFRFEDIAELSLISYLKRKQLTLQNAGFRNETIIKLALGEILDIELKNITVLRIYESLSEFVTRIRKNESVAFAVWQANQRMARSNNIINRSFYRNSNHERVRREDYLTEKRRQTVRKESVIRDRYASAPDRNRPLQIEKVKDKNNQKEEYPSRTKPRKSRRFCGYCREIHGNNDCLTKPKAYQVDDIEYNEEEMLNIDKEDITMRDLQLSDNGSKAENY